MHRRCVDQGGAARSIIVPLPAHRFDGKDAQPVLAGADLLQQGRVDVALYLAAIGGLGRAAGSHLIDKAAVAVVAVAQPDAGENGRFRQAEIVNHFLVNGRLILVYLVNLHLGPIPLLADGHFLADQPDFPIINGQPVGLGLIGHPGGTGRPYHHLLFCLDDGLVEILLVESSRLRRFGHKYPVVPAPVVDGNGFDRPVEQRAGHQIVRCLHPRYPFGR